jgi:hypothetical protein
MGAAVLFNSALRRERPDGGQQTAWQALKRLEIMDAKVKPTRLHRQNPRFNAVVAWPDSNWKNFAPERATL